jgi:hypothetical protein
MDSSSDINRIMRRTQQYWYADGLPDIGMGAWLVVLALFFAAESLTPPGSFLWLIWGVGGPLLLIGGGVVVGGAVKWIKARATFPRTGYVDYERRGLSQTMRMVAVAFIAAAVAGSMVIVNRYGASLTVLFGLAFMAAFAFVGYRFGLRRYLLLGIGALVLGLAIVPLSLGMEQASAVFFGVFGLAMMALGYLTWRQYDRVAPPSQEASDGSRP